MIFTCVPFLLSLLDDEGVNAFENDTSFKRVFGKLNEWELVLFLKSLQRGELLHRLGSAISV